MKTGRCETGVGDGSLSVSVLVAFSPWNIQNTTGDAPTGEPLEISLLREGWQCVLYVCKALAERARLIDPRGARSHLLLTLPQHKRALSSGEMNASVSARSGFNHDLSSQNLCSRCVRLGFRSLKVKAFVLRSDY